ncbi:MAG: RNA polymerase sigma-70 factor [Chitinophagaceae bacterium]|nr:RNA polymerase sigma-70 factor [Chitinophagaceae bacterium]
MNGTAHFENELLHRFTTGDPNAFTTLYKQYHQRIYFFAKTFLPARQDAEDITADTFTKLWNRRDTFRSIAAINSFLHVTARNSCFDFLRHHKVKVEKQAEILRQMELHNNTELQQTKEELLKLVQQEVKKMSAGMKKIFDLSYNEGLTPAEIAESLKLSVQTISNQKTSLLKTLKRALAQVTSFFCILSIVPLLRF